MRFKNPIIVTLLSLFVVLVVNFAVPQEQIFHTIISSLTTMAFAFTHWNNEQPEFIYHYFFAAFISGLAYVYAYKKAGLYSAMLSHTLVDWVWSLLLKRG